MNDRAIRFLGGSPLAVLLRLVVISFVVGVILSALGVSPFDIVDGLRDLVLYLWNVGFDAFGNVGRYLMLGAMVVIPVFIVLRIFSYRR